MWYPWTSEKKTLLVQRIVAPPSHSLKRLQMAGAKDHPAFRLEVGAPSLAEVLGRALVCERLVKVHATSRLPKGVHDANPLEVLRMRRIPSDPRPEAAKVEPLLLERDHLCSGLAAAIV